MRRLAVRDHPAHSLRLHRLPNARQLTPLIVRKTMILVALRRVIFRVSAHNLNVNITVRMPLAVTLTRFV